MLARLRTHFGTAGLVVAIVALIAALGGGALAATNSGDSGKATASAKGKQGPRGKTGKTGPAGPVGPAGPQGSAGANGKDGTNGTNGTNGTKGTTGTTGATGTAGATGKKIIALGSFTGPQETPPNGGPCLGAGGSQYEVQDSAAVETICNGKQGNAGSPWTVGGTLPKGSTETGNWALNGTAGNTGGVYIPISFPIPLSAGLEEEVNQVFYMTPEDVFLENNPSCTGNTGHPTAAEGKLCVYESSQFEVVNATFDKILQAYSTENIGASTAGALLHFKEVSNGAYAAGTWAVTGF